MSAQPDAGPKADAAADHAADDADADHAATASQADALPVCELLRFSAMASGRRLLQLTRRISAAGFEAFASAVAARIGADIVDRAADPVLQLRLLARDGRRWRLCHEQLGAGSECTLEPMDDEADAALDSLRLQLMARLLPLDEVLAHARRPGRIWWAGCTLPEWCWLLDDLGDGDDADNRESWVHEFFDELIAVRQGKLPRFCTGTDAVWVAVDGDSVELTLALPGAPREGPIFEQRAFVQGLLAWFDHSNPALAASLRERLNTAA